MPFAKSNEGAVPRAKDKVALRFLKTIFSLQGLPNKVIAQIRPSFCTFQMMASASFLIVATPHFKLSCTGPSNEGFRRHLLEGAVTGLRLDLLTIEKDGGFVVDSSSFFSIYTSWRQGVLAHSQILQRRMG